MRRFSYIEIALVATFLFMLAGFLFSISKESTLQETKEDVLKTEQEIADTVAFKKAWEGKRLDSKVRNLKSLLPSRAVDEYQVGRKKAQIRLRDVDIKSINRFLVKLSSLPIQFMTLNIKNSGDKYSMECRCKW